MEQGQPAAHSTELFSPVHSILSFKKKKKKKPSHLKHFAKNKVSKILSDFTEEVPIRTYTVLVSV